MYLRVEEQVAKNIDELKKALCNLDLERDRLLKSAAYTPLCNFANNFNIDYCLHKYPQSKSNCPLSGNCERQKVIISQNKKIEEKQAEIKSEEKRYQRLCQGL